MGKEPAARRTPSRWRSQASAAELADIIRGHRGIEDRLHWIRAMAYDEDRSQVRTASGPCVMATLRNLAISMLRLSGATNIAAALRHYARQPRPPLLTIMNCQTTLPGPW